MNLEIVTTLKGQLLAAKASKAIVDEINADIQAYGKKYSAILFIVYDIGSIQDEAAFKQGLERKDGLIHVSVVKH